MMPDCQKRSFDRGVPGGGRAPAQPRPFASAGRAPDPWLVLACALALAGVACGDTLVDHDGDRFYAGHTCQGTPTSCGTGSACADCTDPLQYTTAGNAGPICGAE